MLPALFYTRGSGDLVVACGYGRFCGGGRYGAGWECLDHLQSVSVSVFSHLLFSTTWPGSFSGSFRFVFSTATCFQQLLRFAFRFVPGSLLAIYVAFPCIFNNFSGSFFKKDILFYFLKYKTGEKNPFSAPMLNPRVARFCLPLIHESPRPA
jgi:hypothetical protein